MRDATMDRLSRRGKFSVTANDGVYEARLKAHGPYHGRSWCTTDEGDLYEHLHLGATDWHGTGADLGALLASCEEESRPRWRDIDELVWSIKYRRDTRTTGPPLPSYRRWYGWSPGIGRWLRTSSHAHEYLKGYERDLRIEREFVEERKVQEARRQRQMSKAKS